MTSAEKTSGFHRMTVTGDEHNQAVVVELDMFRPPVDVNNDPQFLGEAPRRTRNGRCDWCGKPWMLHYLHGLPLDPREFHRSVRDGRYSDELAEVQR